MKSYKIVIAETAPIILKGLVDCIEKVKDYNLSVMQVDSRQSLLDTVSGTNVDLTIVNPAFGGLLHPNDIRKSSLNPENKIFALEINKLSRATLSLYDGHIHITDDLNEIKSKLLSIFKMENEENEDKESLSAREKEIISHVVKGFTNQEIADKLFLSVHTVMTHRRNIARKLQIHSATGLTIYAIVNKIVDISDIRL